LIIDTLFPLVKSIILFYFNMDYAVRKFIGQLYILIGSMPIYATCLELLCSWKPQIKGALMLHDLLDLIAEENSASGVIVCRSSC